MRTSDMCTFPRYTHITHIYTSNIHAHIYDIHHVYVYIYVYMCIHVCVYACMHECMCVCIRASKLSTNAHAPACVHTRIRTLYSACGAPYLTRAHA